MSDCTDFLDTSWQSTRTKTQLQKAYINSFTTGLVLLYVQWKFHYGTLPQLGTSLV